MKNPPKFLTGLTLMISIISLAGVLHLSLKQEKAPTHEPTASKEIPFVSSKPIHSVRDLNAIFVEISKKASPAIVTVFIEKITKMQVGNPFFGSPFEDFFDDFFGTPFEQPRSPRQRQQPREFRQQGLGSGVIVSEDGTILTNNHVVSEADTISVRTIKDQTYKAKVIGRDPKTDIAVIKIDVNDLTMIPQGDSDKLEVGEIVLAIGSPMSARLAHTVTQGIVSAKGRSNVGLADYEDFIQTDAAINPGNSGGALINLDGELIGINAAIVSQSGGSQGIGFSVPINMARNVMNSLIKTGKVVRGWLGVVIQDIDENLSKAMNLGKTEGALVSDVAKGGPAEKVGLKSGDVILELNGKKVEKTVQLRNWISSKAPGTEIELTILRDKKEQTVKARLEELPSEAPPSKLPNDQQEKLFDLLGFAVAPLSNDFREKYRIPSETRGLIVRAVNPNSSAYYEGLRENDVIQTFNQQKVETMEDFLQHSKHLQKKKTVLLQLRRGESTFFLAFTL